MAWCGAPASGDEPRQRSRCWRPRSQQPFFSYVTNKDRIDFLGACGCERVEERT